MAAVSTVKVGDFISHYGTFRQVTATSTTPDGVVLVIQEDGVNVPRTEAPKTNLPVRGEPIQTK